MGGATRALLVGRHRLFRECLASRLVAAGRVEVAGQVEELRAVPAWIAERPVDLVLVDLARAEDGAERHLCGVATHGGRVKIVVLGLSDERDEFLRWVQAGASGYVLQESSLGDLEEALERVLAGEVYCSPRVTYTMFDRLGELARERRRLRQAQDLDLTPREMEVLRLIADGLSNRQIAERICLSIYTVKNHVHNILDKLEVDGRERAVEKAFERRWLRERRRTAGS